MDCDRLREVLIEHVDGLLGAVAADQARAHLGACASCRHLQEEVRRNFAALDCWEDEDLPAGAFDRLLARVSSSEVAQTSPEGARIPGPAAIASAAPAPRSWSRLLVPYAAGLATAAAAVVLFILPDGTAPIPGPREPGIAAPPVVRDPPASPRVFSPVEVTATDAIPAGTDPLPAAPRKRGERLLNFRVADEGTLRNFLLPEGVDPKTIVLVDDERPIPVPSGVR